MEQAVPRDPSFDVLCMVYASSSLRLQTCARDPPVRILVIEDERSCEWTRPNPAPGWLYRDYAGGTMGRPD